MAGRGGPPGSGDAPRDISFTGPFAQSHIQDAPGHLRFGHPRKDNRKIALIQDGAAVFLGLEPRLRPGDVVGDDEIQSLFTDLLSGVLQKVPCFGRETHIKPVFLQRGDGFENIRIPCQLEVQPPLAFLLDFLLAHPHRPEIGHGRRHDDPVRIGQGCQNRVEHLPGCRHRPESFYGGGDSATGPDTRVTRAPRRTASAARAYPILPLERLLM